ncbi:MAG: hypothetical protein ACMUIE_03790 [Thermoplasmatota archaeon]
MSKNRKGSEQELYKSYPLSSIILYDGITIVHYILGGLGITIAYSFFEYSYIIGLVYFTFAMIQMYVLMPITVCPSCVYHRMKEGICISGLNKISRGSVMERPLEEFEKRSKGILSPNNLYMAALIIPVPAIIPGLIIDFQFLPFLLLTAVVLLMLFRILVIFPKIACIHCMARYRCPNARQMGLDLK